MTRKQFRVQILDWERPGQGVEADYYLMAESMLAAIETATKRFQTETGKDINKYLVRTHPS